VLNLGTVHASIELRLDRLERGLSEAERKFAATGKKLDSEAQKIKRNLSQSFNDLGRTLTIGLTAPLAALGTAAVKAAVDMDSLKRGLRSVAGSSAEAERQLKRLKEIAKLPGLGFNEAIAGSTRLQAAGLSAQQAEKALLGFGNALATVGRGKADLDGVITALSQIQSKGVISAEEINQIAERVPQIRRIMIDAFGTANTEILQKAKISSTEFIDAITSSLNKLPKVTGGAQNAFENFSDAAKRALTAIGDTLLPAVTRALEKFTPILEDIAANFGKLPDAAKTALGGLALGGAIIGPALMGLGALAKAITDINNLLKGSVLARLLGLGAGTAAAVGTATYLGYKVLSTGVNEEQAARAMRKEREEYLANARRQGPEAFRKAEARVRELYPIGPARVSGMGAVRAVEGEQIGRIPEKDRPGFLSAPERAAALEKAKEAAAEAKRKAEQFAKDVEQARRQLEVDLASFKNKFEGQRVDARAEAASNRKVWEAAMPGSTDQWLKGTLAAIDKAEAEERTRRKEAFQRRMDEVKREADQEEKELKNKRAKQVKDSEDFFKRVADTWDKVGEPAYKRARSKALRESEEFEDRVNKLWQKQGFGAGDAIHRQKMREGADFMDRVNSLSMKTVNINPMMQGLSSSFQGMGESLASTTGAIPRNLEINRVGQFERRVRNAEDKLRQSFGGILGQEIAYEFTDQFARGLEKAFGSSSIGKIFSRALTRWMDSFMQGAVDRTIGGLASSIATGGNPFAGGLFGSIGKLLGFAEGGWVPGPIGAPRPAVVHGGEFVVSRKMQEQGGMGGGLTVNLGGVTIANDYDVDRMIDRIAWQSKRRLAVNPGSG
jgi:tape measure domain-containing protein